MINDLELTTVVDVQGILTPVFTQEDAEKISQKKAIYLGIIYGSLSSQFKNTPYKSEKLALLDIMNDLEHPLLEQHMRAYQDEN